MKNKILLFSFLSPNLKIIFIIALFQKKVNLSTHRSKKNFKFHILILRCNEVLFVRCKLQLNDAVALRLKELMKEKNINQYQLFKSSGVPQSTISTILSGVTSTTKLSTIFAICQGLEIDLETFFKSQLFQNENVTD